MKIFQLDNAEIFNQKFPDSFNLPTKDMRRTVEVSDYVQLIFREETGNVVIRMCMWVMVTDVTVTNTGIVTYIGMLDSEYELYELSAIQHGDSIYFDETHIIDIAH